MKDKRALGKSYRSGETIFRQGDAAGQMYVVVQGRVEIVVESAFGTSHLVTLCKGDVFGHISLFAGKSRFGTARVVVENTRVITLDEKNFVTKLHRDPSLAFRMIRNMAQRIYDQDHELMHGYYDAEKRYRDFLGFQSYIDLAALVELEVERARRLWQTLTLIILHIDGFKEYCEKYGEKFGDQLLNAVADVLEEVLRRRDLIGRYGEARFGILLYEADGSAAVRVMEKVRQLFAGLSHEVDGSQVQATVSCGVASFPEYLLATKLSKAAFAALMTGKREGKDRVVLAHPDRVLGEDPPT